MIDTRQLEKIIVLTRGDKSTVHPSVVKVGKCPDDETITVLGIDTHADSALLLLNMQWDVTSHASELGVASGNDSAYRLKWFNQVARRLNFYAKGTDIQFFVIPDSFEFGARGVKGVKGMVILWASVIVSVVTESEKSE